MNKQLTTSWSLTIFGLTLPQIEEILSVATQVLSMIALVLSIAYTIYQIRKARKGDQS